jgi:hypothetical protein
MAFVVEVRNGGQTKLPPATLAPLKKQKHKRKRERSDEEQAMRKKTRDRPHPGPHCGDDVEAPNRVRIATTRPQITTDDPEV